VTDLLAVFTPPALLAAIASGLVFGAALPWLFRSLTQGIIPNDHINRITLVLMPGVALPLLAVLWTSQIIVEMEQGGPWLRLVGRAILSGIFVVAVTLADLLVQRLRPFVVDLAMNERVDELDQEVDAVRQRTAVMRAERLHDQEARLRALDAQVSTQKAAKRR